MDLKDKDLMTFMRERGVNDKIVNNPSFSTMVGTDVDVLWTSIRDFEHSDIQKNYQGYDSITFYSGLDNSLEIVFRPGGDGIEFRKSNKSLDGLDGSYTASISLENDKVVTRRFSFTGNNTYNQIEKSYDATGIQMVHSYVVGPDVQAGKANSAMMDSFDIEEWTIARREPNGYVACVHSKVKSGMIDGFVKLDMQDPLTMSFSPGRQFIQYQSLISEVSKQNIPLPMSDFEKNVFLGGIANEVARDAFKVMLERPYNVKYSSGVQQTSNQNTSTHHM